MFEDLETRIHVHHWLATNISITVMASLIDSAELVLISSLA
jgi:hypothetical protein